MKQSLSKSQIDSVFMKLAEANGSFNKHYPGDSAARQPVHTVYGGAQLFKADSAKKLGAMAVKSMDEYAKSPEVLAKALGLPGDKKLHATIHERVRAKLEKEAVEDFRIDFEDGYGNRPDDEEDGHASSVAEEVARGMQEGVLPPFIGIRIKPFNEELKHRSARTLDIFISTLLEKSGGKLPDNFVVTLPKITIPEQATAFVALLKGLESANGLRPGTLKLELMVEQTQTIISSEGICPLPAMIAACEGRCTGAHFGTYDYTASCNITAAHQAMDHPACDFARSMMKVALSGTGIWLSDGATNVMPIGSEEVVHNAWKLSYDHIRHSLRNGFYQGWDLHPAQLPVRYAACYGFFLEGLEAASLRLRSFMDKAAQATLVGDVFDDAATGQGLLNYFLRALNCGAITEDEVKTTGLTLDEIRTRSFVKVLNARRAAVATR
jgi:citrate lyase beta subunit